MPSTTRAAAVRWKWFGVYEKINDEKAWRFVRFCGLRNLSLGDQEKNCSIAKYYPYQESQLISESKSENVKVKSGSER